MSNVHRPQHVPTFLIWGGWYGSRNIGDSAILLGLKALIQQVNGSREVYIRALSTDPDYTSTHGVTGERALIKSDVVKPWAWSRILFAFARPDRIVVSGGTPIFDSSHAIRTLYMTLPRLFRVPMIVFGAGVKPVRTAYGRASVPFFLRYARYISVRDADSKSLLEELGLPDVHLTADSAFFASPAAAENVDSLLEGYGIGATERLLVVAPRLLSTERRRLYLQEEMDADLIERTPLRIAHVVDSVASSFDKILLMPMHFYGSDSDLPIMRAIADAMRSRNVVLLDREPRPEMAIGILKRARLVLGMRLHALLLAASMGTPIVGIAYERKVESLFERLGLPRYCVSLFDFEEATLEAAARLAISNENEIRQHLASRVKHLREMVLASAGVALRYDG